MKIKLDENVPVSLTQIFSEHGCSVDTVHSEGLKGTDDQTLFDKVNGEERILITCDLDFADVRHFVPAKSSGIVVLRLSQRSIKNVARRMRQFLSTIQIEELHGATTIVSDVRIRFRR